MSLSVFLRLYFNSLSGGAKLPTNFQGHTTQKTVIILYQTKATKQLTRECHFFVPQLKDFKVNIDVLPN